MRTLLTFVLFGLVGCGHYQRPDASTETVKAGTAQTETKKGCCADGEKKDHKCGAGGCSL